MNAASPEPTGRGSEDPSDEVLVAYLDGQLSASESERIESRLATDDATRSRLQSLDRVWTALDVLPRSTASAAFTRTTVEMAAVASSPKRGLLDVHDDAKPTRRRVPRWLLTSVGGLATGWLLAFVLLGLRERGLLADLPVAIHAGTLDQATSIDFLRAFSDRVGDRMGALASDEVRSRAATWGTLVGGSLPERRRWAESQSPADTADIAASMASFYATPSAKRTALREFSKVIDASPNADALRVAALAYERLVGRLSAGERAELREMDADDRLAAVERQAKWMVRDLALELTDAERAVFREAVVRVVSANDSFSSADQEPSGERLRRRYRRLCREDPMGALAMACEAVERGRGRRPPPWLPPEFASVANGMRDHLDAAFAAWLPELTPALPTRVAAIFERARGDREKARLLIHLVRAVPERDLASVFANEIDRDEMDALLLLPRNEFEDALKERVAPETGSPRRDSIGRFEGARPPFGRGPRGAPMPGRGPRPLRPPPGPSR